MNQFELLRFEKATALAKKAASDCLDQVVNASADSPFCLALSGGRIAQGFFSAFVDEAQRRSVNLNSIEFFWADERCVPPTDPESNFGIAQRLLFRPLQVRDSRIHRIQGELLPEKAAAIASETLLQVVPTRAE